MATLGTRVEDLIGIVSDTAATDSALTDAAQEVLNVLPDECLWLVIDESADIVSNGYSVDTCKVMAVTRDGEFCKLMPLAYENRVINVPESLFAPSTNMPVYILKENKISVYPTGFGQFKVQKVNYPTILSTDTNIGKIEKSGVAVAPGDGEFTKTSHGLSVGDSVTLENWTTDTGSFPFPELEGLTSQVSGTEPFSSSTFYLEGINEAGEAATGSFVSGTNFPKELEHIVVLGAALKGRIWQLVDKRISLPAAPTVVTLSSPPSLVAIDTNVSSPISSTYTAPTAPTKPGAANFTYTPPSLPNSPGAPTFIYAPPTAPNTPGAPDFTYTPPTPPIPPSGPGFTYSSPTPFPTAPGTPFFQYTSPTITLDTAPVITDLDLSGITIPSSPAVSISYTAATNADATNSDASSQATGPTSVGSVPVVADAAYGALPTVPTYITPPVTTNFTAAETYISGNEDIELAQANISKNQAVLQEYQLTISNNLNKFNAESQEYQASIKKLDREFEDSIKQNIADAQNQVTKILKQADLDAAAAQQDARNATESNLRNKAQDQSLEIQNKAQDQVLAITNAAKIVETDIENSRQKVQLFQAEVQKYQQEVVSAIQEYQVNEIQKEIALWQGEQTHKIQKYTADINNAQASYRSSFDEYAAENSKFAAEVQGWGLKIQDAQAAYREAVDEYSAESGRYQSEIQKYSAELGNAQASYREAVDEYTATSGKYSAEIQLYSIQVGDSQAAYKKEVDEYTASMSKFGSEVQLYGAELQNAQAVYKKSFDEKASDNQLYGVELQAYATDLQNAAQEYKVSLDTFSNELQALSAINQSIIANNNSAIQHWQSENSLDVTNYQYQVQEYQAEVGRYQGEHGLMMQEQQAIQQQYQVALQGYMSKYQPTPGVQGNA